MACNRACGKPASPTNTIKSGIAAKRSLAMLIALIWDLKPLCYSAATIAGSQTQFVFCFGVVP